MKEKIEEAYKIYIKNCHNNLKDLEVVIQISPKGFLELEQEIMTNVEYLINQSVGFIPLHGRKTPVLLEDKLPSDVEFSIQSRKDYERAEIEKLHNKFNKIFGG